MVKARAPTPSGHQIMKPRMINAIQAGFPKASSCAVMGIVDLA
jgi:hypothetical protein